MGLTSNPWPWPLKVYVERSAFALKRRCDYACDEQSFAHSFQFADCTAHARRPQREPSLPRQESYHGRKSLIPLSHLCGSSRGSLRFWKYWWSAEGCGCLAEGRGRLTFSLWSIRFLHGLRAVRGIFAVFSITVEHRGLNRTVWKGYWPMKAFLTVRWSNKQHWSNGRCYSCYERHQRSQFIQAGIELSSTSDIYSLYRLYACNFCKGLPEPTRALCSVPRPTSHVPQTRQWQSYDKLQKCALSVYQNRANSLHV